MYWIVLLVLQIGYMYRLLKGGEEGVKSAANVAAHFIVSNLLVFVFIMLWTRSRFVVAEIMLLVNFVNLTTLYTRHPFAESPNIWFQHIPITSGPLAWCFVALFWNGAVMVGAKNLAARILANVAIWGWLLWGVLFLTTYKDWTMGGAMSWLSFGKAHPFSAWGLFVLKIADLYVQFSPSNPSTHYQGRGAAMDLCLCHHGVAGCGEFRRSSARGIWEGVECPKDSDWG